MTENETEQKISDDLDRPNEKLPKWDFEQSDKLIGIYHGSSPGRDKKTRNLVFMELESPAGSGTRYSVLAGTVLRSSFAELKVQPGDKVGIKYLGMKSPKDGGKPYKNFKVVVHR